MTAHKSLEPAPPEVITMVEGLVNDAARQRAVGGITALFAKAPRPVIFARAKLRVVEARPANERAIVQGTLDVSGAILRAEATAPTPAEAVDRMLDRLDRRVRRLAERRQDATQRPPSTPPGEWRRGDLPDVRPGYFDRPAAERRIVRRKSLAPVELSVEEAVFDLDVLDHRFYLFTDQADGEPSIVYESPTPEEVSLRRLSGGQPAADRPLPVAVNTAAASILTDAEAMDYLNMTADPFVFYRKADSKEACVLYRRYDGHYGLIEPR